MHMADALISPAVGLAMGAVSAVAIGVSVTKINRGELPEKKIPIMGVAGALVFAAQMINFTIPATGSSGHIGGGAMLAGMLGGFPAFLSITAVLIIQCLFFADGGLLALGCNIFNLGVIPCLLIYPLVFKPILDGGRRDKNGSEYKRLSVASVISAVLGLQLGAFCVVTQTYLSGITALPFGTFAALMLPIHLAIGLVEGVVTAAVLCFVYKMRPDIIVRREPETDTQTYSYALPVQTADAFLKSEADTQTRSDAIPEQINGASTQIAGVYAKPDAFSKPGAFLIHAKAPSRPNVFLIVLTAITIITGGVLSLFASTHPDGLEWSVEKTTALVAGVPQTELEAEGGIYDGAADIQKAAAFLPDYAFADDPENAVGTTVSGILGVVITFTLAGAAGLLITMIKRQKKVKRNA